MESPEIFLHFRGINKSAALKLNENGLVALALLIAESDPAQKDILIRLIVNILLY